MKRSLIIVLALVLIIGAGIAAYFFFFANEGGAQPGVSLGGATLPSAGSATQSAGTTTSETPTVSSGGSSTETSKATSVSARLVKIDAGPVVPGAAVVAVPAKRGSSAPEIVVSFVERESGNVFTYSASTQVTTRTSNKTLPGIQSAVWSPTGSFAVVRYLSGDDLSVINSYALFATTSEGFFLPQGLADVAVGVGGILTLVSGSNNSTASLSRLDGSRATTVFSTPLSSLRVSFAGKGQYLAVSKPSATLAGGAFLVGSTGRLSRIAGPLNGLVALASPSGKTILVSYTTDSGSMATELVDVSTGATTPLPLATIADKCVWSTDSSTIYCGVPSDPPPAAYPDDWYQGVIHFSDRIWRIDVAGRYAQMILDFQNEAKASLDAEAPAIDSSGLFLSFVNKNDGSLWGYSL